MRRNGINFASGLKIALIIELSTTISYKGAKIVAI